MEQTITTLDELQSFLAEMPEGTDLIGILPSELEAGNFAQASFLTPDGQEINVSYTGPVADGYVGPFETI